MKIVDLQGFLSLPAGTIFSTYKRDSFGPISIKGDSAGPTWNELFVFDFADAMACEPDIEVSEVLEKARKSSASVVRDIAEDRAYDADWDRLFAVWERADVEALIGRMRETVR
jgi:hypothetical protein